MDARRLLSSLTELETAVPSAKARKALGDLEAQVVVIRERTQDGEVQLGSVEAAELVFDFSLKAVALTAVLVEQANRKVSLALHQNVDLEQRLSENEKQLIERLESTPAGAYVADLIRQRS